MVSNPRVVVTDIRKTSIRLDQKMDRVRSQGINQYPQLMCVWSPTGSGKTSVALGRRRTRSLLCLLETFLYAQAMLRQSIKFTSRTEAFPTPVASYKILLIFGKIMISTEWKHYRKATAPCFNQENNILVFAEACDQTLGLL